MKRTLSIALLMAALVVNGSDLWIGAPAGNIITMTGSAIRFVPNPSTAAPIQCASILVQQLAGSSNLMYVLNAAPNVTMALNGAGTTTVAQLGGATATTPGNSVTIPSNNPSASASGYIDMRYFGIYGTASDTALVTCQVK